MRKDAPFWQFLLQQQQPIALLTVVSSAGSSPGREGFSMLININGEMRGTIGGGIMEQKLSILAQKLLHKKQSTPKLIAQYHDKIHRVNQSGMICSGEQWIAIIPLFGETLALWKTHIEDYLNGAKTIISISPQRAIIKKAASIINPNWQYSDEDHWQYRYSLGLLPHLHIIGGGHVGLALSQVMASLDFHVSIYDNRPHLHTMEINTYADQKNVVEYEEIGHLLRDKQEDYVVIVTFGYRTDKTVLASLIAHQFKFLGMMGSQTKITHLKKELLAEGISQHQLEQLHAPIGLPIDSKTTQEIAISIAAQLIAIKNNPN